MSIEELCTKPVATIDGGATIMQAAAAMRSQNVGDLVVVRRRDGQAVPAGIINQERSVEKGKTEDSFQDEFAT